MNMLQNTLLVPAIILVVVAIGIIAMVAKWYRKAAQGQAIVKTGVGGTKVSFNGMMIIPVLHRMEIMDISLKNDF